MKKYEKPQVTVNSFISENVIAKSGLASTPHTLALKGNNVGTISNLFGN